MLPVDPRYSSRLQRRHRSRTGERSLEMPPTIKSSSTLLYSSDRFIPSCQLGSLADKYALRPGNSRERAGESTRSKKDLLLKAYILDEGLAPQMNFPINTHRGRNAIVPRHEHHNFSFRAPKTNSMFTRFTPLGSTVKKKRTHGHNTRNASRASSMVSNNRMSFSSSVADADDIKRRLRYAATPRVRREAEMKTKITLGQQRQPGGRRKSIGLGQEIR
mmetsp:Transcript_6855/g.12569  ORF Transcript_6855/g.12569 Transcript_6855/m.12569 type:complete len:218 (-) Transcript_6855:524-1177(-)